MRYVVDHDYHIHSHLSLCSNDVEQTPERILSYGEQNGYTSLCLTNHYWDEAVPGASDWYKPQNTAHVWSSLPLPQGKSRFYFGVETDMDQYLNLGISRERMDELDFIIVPTNHFHMEGFTIAQNRNSVQTRTETYVEHFDALLKKDLPFHKIGIAHLTCPLLYTPDHLGVLNMISSDKFRSLFSRAAEKGMGIELNFPAAAYHGKAREDVLRPYRLAKEEGCKFYFGSDAHHPRNLDAAKQNFETIVTLLELEETDKFRFPV